MTRWLARCAGAALCLLVAACSSAHYAINPPLTQVDPNKGYRLQRFVAQDPDDRLFKGSRFGDLSAQPRKPFAVIYAADMVSGSRFEFVQEQFDFLCSDLDDFKLARAVATSSAVPLLLSPVTFWNHAGAAPGKDCGPPLLRQAAHSQSSHVSSRRLMELEGYRDLRAAEPRRPFIHLIDGGQADNVSARAPEDLSTQE